jgi:hypothetical protein
MAPLSSWSASWLISSHLTERTQQHDSTVNPDQQRESIARVVHLFRDAPKVRGGEGTPPGGEDKKKAG